MWQCPECKYQNDDWDDRCAKCGHSQPTSADATIQSQAAVTQITRDREGREKFGEQKKPRQQMGSVEKVSLVLVIASVLVLLVAGYVAWQRGYFSLETIGLKQDSQQMQATVAVKDTWPPDDHVLGPVVVGELPGNKHAASYAEELLDFELALNELIAPEVTRGNLDEAEDAYLYRLNQMGRELLDSYRRFEQTAEIREGEETREAFEVVRTQYVTDFSNLLTEIGILYSHDTSGVHPAYILSDDIREQLMIYDVQAGALIEDTWMQAVYNRRQLELEEEQADILRELQTHLSELQSIHVEFGKALNDLPPYGEQNGYIDNVAHDTLTVLAAFAIQVEEKVIEYEKFAKGINEDRLADRVVETMEDFESMAQEDHLYVFSEIYNIYAIDKNLEDPVYVMLAEFYDFAEQHWPELSGTYQKVYREQESIWLRRWRE